MELLKATFLVSSTTEAEAGGAIIEPIPEQTVNNILLLSIFRSIMKGQQFRYKFML